jgi:hypothetical protein
MQLTNFKLYGNTPLKSSRKRMDYRALMGFTAKGRQIYKEKNKCAADVIIENCPNA